MTKRPRCPCNNSRCKGRGLYARPEGSFTRRPDLWEGSKCGRIFWAPKTDPGKWRPYAIKATLLHPAEVPDTVIDAVLNEYDGDEPPEELISLLEDRFPDAEDTLEHLATAAANPAKPPEDEDDD